MLSTATPLLTSRLKESCEAQLAEISFNLHILSSHFSLPNTQCMLLAFRHYCLCIIHIKENQLYVIVSSKCSVIGLVLKYANEPRFHTRVDGTL